MNIADLAVTSLETITAFDPVSGAYLWTLDELQNASIANSQETTDITGKQGRLLNRLKRNKSVTISGTNGLVSGGLIGTQVGDDFQTKNTEVLWTDYLAVNASHEATTSYKAIGTSGAEIDALYIRNSDGTLGSALTQDSTAAAGKFAYAPATKKLTFYTDVAEGTEIVVYYKRNISANTVSNISDHYSKKATLYIDAMAEDRCANVYRIQFYVPLADFSGEFTIDLGDNQTTHGFEATSLASACVSGSSALLWTYTVFGANAEDAA